MPYFWCTILLKVLVLTQVPSSARIFIDIPRVRCSSSSRLDVSARWRPLGSCQEYKNYRSLFCLIKNKQQSYFSLFVCLRCSLTILKTPPKFIEVVKFSNCIISLFHHVAVSKVRRLFEFFSNIIEHLDP